MNSTKLAAGYAPGRLKSGQLCLVVVAKATYDFPEEQGKPLKLAREQVEPLSADIPSGDPETTPALLENDYAPFKPQCDVIVLGSAHAPDNEPSTKVRVGVQLGGWSKQFDVLGDRYWLKGMTGWQPSKPEPFVQKPLSWMIAYGGTDPYKEGQIKTFPSNPSGIGYWHRLDNRLQGMPVPSTEQPGKPIKNPGGHYLPQGFGPVGRHWIPRRNYAGTYDEQWKKERAPYLPADFDERYYQCAPEDQQRPYLTGAEPITLLNLVPEGMFQFRLPTRLSISTSAQMADGSRVIEPAHADTLIIDADQRKVMVVWRAHFPVKQGLNEYQTLLVGKPTPGWERARLAGKFYVPLTKLKESKHLLRK